MAAISVCSHDLFVTSGWWWLGRQGTRALLSFLIRSLIFLSQDSTLMTSFHLVVVIQSFSPTLCDPMDYSMPGFPVLHHLLELAKTPVELVMPSNHLILSCPLLHLPSVFRSIPVSFPVSPLFQSGGQRIAASALASVLPMNIQC